MKMTIKKARQITEQELFLPIKRLFPAKHYLVRREIPFNAKIIDVLLMDMKTHRLIAIEMKIRRWKKALRQAAVYQLVTSQVYIALWYRHINEVNKELIGKYGIGIIEVKKNGPKTLKAKIILSPKQLKLLNRQYAKQLRTYFKTENMKSGENSIVT